MSEWIEWKGGKRPVADGTMVEVVLRDETIDTHDPNAEAAEDWSWTHLGFDGDIIAYRIVDAPQDPKDARIAELEAENATLRKDAARLDYLDSLATYEGRSFMGGTHRLEFVHEFDTPNGSFRAAIDAAMQESRDA